MWLFKLCKGGLRSRFTSHNPFLTILNCYLSVMSHSVKKITYMINLLRDGSKTTNIPGLHVVLMWIVLIIKSWQKEYGIWAAAINVWKKEADAQWSIWHEYCQQFDYRMGLEVCASRFVSVVSGIILFPCDVKWMDSRMKTPYRASKFENLSYNLPIVTMDKE